MFVDGDLHVGPLPDGSTDLVERVGSHAGGTALGDWALGDWSSKDRELLLLVADRAQTLLDTVDRVCLVHSDFNAKNLLVDHTGEVTGLLDWEFAHAGRPHADLGNLLRFEREPAFTEAVLTAYAEGVPDAQDNLLELARAADLYALVDLAGRRGENPVTERAHDLLLRVARTGDLHARP